MANNESPNQEVSPRLHREDGFSLIELLVVIAIFVTLAGIAFLAMGPTVRTYRLKGAARQIYSDALKVRMRAIKEGKVTGLDFTSGSNYTIWAENDPNSITASLSGYGQLDICGPETENKPRDFVFYPNGSATLGEITVSVVNDAWRVRVTTGGTGNVKIERTTSCP